MVADEALDLTLEEPRWELVRVVGIALSRIRWGLRLLLVGASILDSGPGCVRLPDAIRHPPLGGSLRSGGLPVSDGLVRRPAPGPLDSGPSGGVTAAHAGGSGAHGSPRSPPACLSRRLSQEPAAQSGDEDSILRIDSELETLGDLRVEAQKIEDPRELSARVVHFERNAMVPILEPLDRRAEVLIHRESLAIGTMTALSPNGTVDAFIVLWRNVNLVAALARLYYGRPGLSGTWLIVRDVASAILLSSVLERLSDMGGGILRRVGEGGRTIPLLGAVVGPMLDGTINGLMTMKVGYLGPGTMPFVPCLGWEDQAGYSPQDLPLGCRLGRAPRGGALQDGGPLGEPGEGDRGRRQGRSPVQWGARPWTC